jgi:hypothetical protein
MFKLEANAVSRAAARSSPFSNTGDNLSLFLAARFFADFLFLFEGLKSREKKIDGQATNNYI